MPFSRNRPKATTGIQVFSQVKKYTLSYRFSYGNVHRCVFAKNRPVSLNWTDYTSVPHKNMRFYMYRRYRISNNYVLLTDLTTSNRNNRLESEMTTLGPACRLLGFIKMSDFSACLLYSSLLKQ